MNIPPSCSPQSWEETTEEAEGAFGGIGIQVQPKKDHLHVITPIEGSPAARAGILPADRIIAVENKKMPEKLDPSEAVKYIRGEPGSHVQLTIERGEPPQTQILDFTLSRDIIQLIYVKGRFLKEFQKQVIPEKIAYLRITSFMGKKLVNEFKKYLDGFLSEGMQGLILDLRKQPGRPPHQCHRNCRSVHPSRKTPRNAWTSRH
jgi:carboxyl-terminal processing protease